jgi:isochorismate synthase
MDTLAPVSGLTHTETELLSFLVQYSADKKLPIVFWRLPQSRIKNAIVSEAVQKIDPTQPFEVLGSGFLTAPFDKNKYRYFLAADLFFSFEDGKLATREHTDDGSSSWLVEKASGYKTKTQREVTSPPPVPLISSDEAKDTFIRLVQSALSEIAHGKFEKIVPSRKKAIDLPADFDVVSSFQNLCQRYPQALVSFVSIPGIGTWLGASPEVLVSVEGGKTFKTVALAGTLPYHTGLNLKSVAWTQKEIEEQALVERYVISCFKNIRLREYEEHGPKTSVAGNLMHLKSEFTVDMKATNFPQLGSVMLKLLHPTSAVCGMPLDPSLEFLRNHEGYDREFYAGYLGPVNVHNNTDLFVNLRCMQILDKRGVLYAGAGVTIDSNPEEEWAETEMKFNTLLNVIL